MLLRVRGSGGCAENSQAVLMNLRGFRRQRHSTPFPMFSVHVDCSYCSLLPTWREVWNVYDIAYDDIDTELPHWSAETRNSSVVVSHDLQWGDDSGSASLLKESQSTVQSWGVNGSTRPLMLAFDGILKKEKPVQDMVVQLAFASTLLKAAKVSPQSVKRVLLLTNRETGETTSMSNASSLQKLFQFLSHSLVHPDAPMDDTFTECVDCGTESFSSRVVTTDGSSERPLVLAFVSDRCIGAEDHVVLDGALQRLADEGHVEVHRVVVPVQRFHDSDAASTAQTLLEAAAVAKENMVLNFCPCCGHTDDGSSGCGGHRH